MYDIYLQLQNEINMLIQHLVKNNGEWMYIFIVAISKGTPKYIR